MSKPESKPLSIVPLLIGGVLVAALLGFAFWRMSSSQSAPAATTTTVAEAPAHDEAARNTMPRITVAELRDRLAKNEITLIDVRDADAYVDAHIPGSLHIPLSRIEGEISYLPKGKTVVTYCTCPHDEAAADANMILQHGGVPGAFALAGGLGAWREAGLPVEAGEK